MIVYYHIAPLRVNEKVVLEELFALAGYSPIDRSDNIFGKLVSSRQAHIFDVNAHQLGSECKALRYKQKDDTSCCK